MTAALSGSLDTFTVGQILPLLAAARTTGVLRVRTDGDEGRIHCRDGAVAFATIGAETGFGDVLVRSGLVDAEHWTEIAVDTEGADAVHDVLTDDAVDAERIHRLLVRHVEEAAFELDRWTAGEFRVQPGAAHPLAAHVALDVGALLAAVDERRSAWPGLMARIGSEDRIVHRARIPVDDEAELRITRTQLAVLTHVDGTRSTRELARLLGTGLFQTCEVIAALADAGLVVLSADRSAGPRPVVETPVSAASPAAAAAEPSADAASGGFEFVEPGPGPAQDLILRLLSAVKEEL